MQLRKGIVPVVLGIALLGCGDKKKTITGPGDTLACTTYGTSNITISGAITGTLNKCTAYFVANDGSGPSTALAFHSANLLDSRFDMILTRDAGRPATGTYAIGSNADQFGALVTDSLGSRAFVSTGGSVTITSSSSGTLAGNLSITAEEITSSGTPPTITISGSFTAKCTGAGSSGGTTISC